MSLCLRVVLRIKEAGGASSESAAAFYKHEGTRFTGTSGEHANATVKLVEVENSKMRSIKILSQDVVKIIKHAFCIVRIVTRYFANRFR